MSSSIDSLLVMSREKNRLPRVLFAYILRIECNVWHLTWKLDNAIAYFSIWSNYIKGAMNPNYSTPDVDVDSKAKELFISVRFEIYCTEFKRLWCNDRLLTSGNWCRFLPPGSEREVIGLRTNPEPRNVSFV